MTNRFFVDRTVSRWEGTSVLLAGDEAHHFCKVMRGKVGDSLVLFDGTETFVHGIVEAIQKEGVRVRITETFADEVESPLRLTVAAALPKGDRQRFLIEKLAELGVARFVPVSMERSVARANDAAIQRLRRYVVEAAKQCGRNVLMEITEEVPMGKLTDFLAADAMAKFLLHPVALGSVGQTTARQILSDRPEPGRAVGSALAQPPSPRRVSVVGLTESHPEISNQLQYSIAILVGPEGSFTDQEIAVALQGGFKPLDLGKRILRTETACIAAAALLLTVAG